jgi:hypothetical protein
VTQYLVLYHYGDSHDYQHARVSAANADAAFDLATRDLPDPHRLGISGEVYALVRDEPDPPAPAPLCGDPQCMAERRTLDADTDREYAEKIEAIVRDTRERENWG